MKVPAISPARKPSAAYRRAAELLDGKSRRKREIVTPEGVPVTVEIADYGERLIAFVIDLTIWLLVTIAIYVPLISAFFAGHGSVIALAIALFVAFLVRNLYFVYFELAWRGATPGKRVVGLRVIDRQGGPLSATAIIARNLTREVEMFIPIGVLLQSSRVFSGMTGLTEFVASAWVLFFLIVPFLNRDRMRGGDMIAGTIVIALPKRVLLRDLVEEALRFNFTPGQLQAYGAFELQVLEELLRRPRNEQSTRVLEDLCDKICHKIGWAAPVPRRDVVTFLSDFYTAERAFLEREQLYGRARADKYAAPPTVR